MSVFCGDYCKLANDFKIHKKNRKPNFFAKKEH